jgi:hypothetical protein
MPYSNAGLVRAPVTAISGVCRAILGALRKLRSWF